MAALDQGFVSSGSGLAFIRKFAKRAGIFRITHLAQFEAEIPNIKVIDAPARVLFTAVTLIENNPGIGPDGTGELFVKARCHHGPFAAERMADDSDSIRSH